MWEYIVGFMTVEVKTAMMDTFIDEVVRHGVRLKNVRRVSYSKAFFTISAPDYLRIKSAMKDFSYENKIVRYGGAMCLMNLVRRRPAAVFAFLAALCAVLVLSCFCFGVKIVGAETINEFRLNDMIHDCGAVAGAPKSSIDLEQLKDKIQETFPNVIFVEAKFTGVILKVEILEGTEKPELAELKPCDILADKRGVVTSIVPLRGQAQVAPGDVVEVGDVLIAGKFEKREYSFVTPADGTVCAQVDYYGKARVSEDNGELTGRTAVEIWMRLGKSMFPISGKNPFDTFETAEKSEGMIGVNAALPLELISIERRETKKTVNSSRQAELSAREAAYYNALKQIGDYEEVCGFSSSIDPGEDEEQYVTAMVTVIQEIGVKREFTETEIAEAQNKDREDEVGTE